MAVDRVERAAGVVDVAVRLRLVQPRPPPRGIALLTPADVHVGRAEQVTIARVGVLDGAYEAHPERFVRQPPEPPRLPGAMWINKPVDPTEPPQEFRLF